jgi:hypothetical protein
VEVNFGKKINFLYKFLINNIKKIFYVYPSLDKALVNFPNVCARESCSMKTRLISPPRKLPLNPGNTSRSCCAYYFTGRGSRTPSSRFPIAKPCPPARCNRSRRMYSLLLHRVNPARRFPLNRNPSLPRALFLMKGLLLYHLMRCCLGN